MKIVYITPGFGGVFYCQNCFRNNTILERMRCLGHEIISLPLYLPLNFTGGVTEKIFFGAINIYLREKFPCYRYMPLALQDFFNRPGFLRLTAKFSGATSACKLEDITLSMLDGEYGSQKRDLEILIKFLQQIKPDAVHLSNALLAGLAHRIRENGIPVICTLQDEDTWLDSMREPWKSGAWQLLARKCRDISMFTSVSEYYLEFMKQKLGIHKENSAIIPPGLDMDKYHTSPAEPCGRTIGFLSRLSEYTGLGILIDAFITLKKQAQFSDLQLRVSGGLIGSDRPFISKCRKKLLQNKCLASFSCLPDLYKNNMNDFFSGLTVLSVPVPHGDAFGTYQIEAMASGIPVVQPDKGAFPEVIEKTGGGIIFRPDTPDALASALQQILCDPVRRNKLGRTGQESVRKFYSADII
ncbi:MAG TPA: hypothetical protein DC049_06500, partial [Spirochaetia bacterium]|nr:hypothetical protein [Spirochaetia bacterium]